MPEHHMFRYHFTTLSAVLQWFSGSNTHQGGGKSNKRIVSIDFPAFPAGINRV